MKFLSFLKFALLSSGVIVFVVAVNSISGTVQVAINEYVVQVPLSYFLVVLLSYTIVTFLLYFVLRFLWSIPRKYNDFLRKKRLLKVQNLILDSFSSLHAKQLEEAQNFSLTAYQLDPSNPIALYLAAQTFDGVDEKQSLSLFNQMIKEPRLKFLGLLGLMGIEKRKKDYLKVDELLSQLFKMRHDSSVVLNAILENDLRLLKNGWQSCIQSAAVSKQVSADVWAQHVILQNILIAERRIELHDNEGAKEILKKILNHKKVFLWGILQFIKLEENVDSKSFKVLLNAAKETPHPDLLKALVRSNGFESSAAAFNYLSNSLDLTNYEVMIFLSNLAYDLQLFDSSLHFAQLAYASYPTIRSQKTLFHVLKTMNKDSSFMHNQDLIQDSSWICSGCSRAVEHYAVFCPCCDGVDLISYNLPVKILNKHPNVLRSGHLKAV